MKYEGVFIDTNILVYAHDIDAGERHKEAHKLVTQLWREANVPFISAQVLHELYATLLKRGESQPKAKDISTTYLSWRVIDNDRATFLQATELQVKWKISFWDSLILAAAVRARAKVLLTEDLNHNQLIEGIRITNPFRK